MRSHTLQSFLDLPPPPSLETRGSFRSLQPVLVLSGRLQMTLQSTPKVVAIFSQPFTPAATPLQEEDEDFHH